MELSRCMGFGLPDNGYDKELSFKQQNECPASIKYIYIREILLKTSRALQSEEWCVNKL